MVNKVKKPLDHAKQSATDALKTSSKRLIQKKQQKQLGDLISNKIADQITKTTSQLRQDCFRNMKNQQNYKKEDTYQQKKTAVYQLRLKQYVIIIMEYQELIHLLYSTANQTLKKRTKT